MTQARGRTCFRWGARWEHWRRTRWWGLISALLGLLAWYVAAASAGRPDLDLVSGDLLLLTGTAAAVAASLVVRDWWARAAVVIVASTVFWTRGTPATDVGHEPLILAAMLAFTQGVGFAVGSLGRRSLVGWALTLAFLAGLIVSTGIATVVLVLALAACGLLVRRERPNNLAASVTLLATAAVGIGTQVLAVALRYGWTEVRRGSGVPRSARGAVARVLERMADLLRTRWADLTSTAVSTHLAALSIGVLAALAVAGVRMAKRREEPQALD